MHAPKVKKPSGISLSLSGQEKRTAARIRIGLKCSLSVEETQQVLSGDCIDLSASGALVITSEAIALGSHIKFSLTEHLGTAPYEANAEVTRSIALPYDEGISSGNESLKRYRIGLRILT